MTRPAIGRIMMTERRTPMPPKRSTVVQAKYDAANTTRVGLKLNNRTDADIIRKLQQEKLGAGIQPYIKGLIRNDLKRGE